MALLRQPALRAALLAELQQVGERGALPGRLLHGPQAFSALR